jgi:2-oxoisovalerate dehydrogenase E1 component
LKQTLLDSLLEQALRIRSFESRLLQEFKEGRIHGTTHICHGQEWTDVSVISALSPDEDFVVSNHRCHGHYLAWTGDYRGLLAEIRGSSLGVSGGRGGTQHILTDSFYAGGIQGAGLSFAAGIAQAKKLSDNDGIVCAFIGDGTWGEGVVYEVLNLASLFELPLLVICENNQIAQTTPIERAMAGCIKRRVEAFSIAYKNARQNEDLPLNARHWVDEVRHTKRPLVAEIEVQRLGPHSRRDETRSASEMKKIYAMDFLSQAKGDIERDEKEIEKVFQRKLSDEPDFSHVSPIRQCEEILDVNLNSASLKATLNKVLEFLLSSGVALLYGEDICSGGAFGVTSSLKMKYPDKVFDTPISEQAVAGMCCGLAFCGYRPVMELMFSDFSTLCSDTIINLAAKIDGLMASKGKCPVIFRFPSGGYQGYGATHSQSMETIFLSVPGLKVISAHLLLSFEVLSEGIQEESSPMILVEHKDDYPCAFSSYITSETKIQRTEGRWPWYRISTGEEATLLLLAYGGQVKHAMEAARIIAKEGIGVHIVVPTSLSPLEPCRFLEQTQYKDVVIIEEGPLQGYGFSEQMISLFYKNGSRASVTVVRGEGMIIPSGKEQEKRCLPSSDDILNAIGIRKDKKQKILQIPASISRDIPAVLCSSVDTSALVIYEMLRLLPDDVFHVGYEHVMNETAFKQKKEWWLGKNPVELNELLQNRDSSQESLMDILFLDFEGSSICDRDSAPSMMQLSIGDITLDSRTLTLSYDHAQFNGKQMASLLEKLWERLLSYLEISGT